MWIVVGPFSDGEVVSENTQRPKLLKCGSEYTVGRKDGCPLLVQTPRLSRDAGLVSVDMQSNDELFQLDNIPTLQFLCKTKNISIIRAGEDEVPVVSGSSTVILPGDFLKLLRTHQLQFQWESVTCFSETPFDTREYPHYAALGLKIASHHSSQVTHFISEVLSASPLQLSTLLINAKMVTGAWLSALLQRSLLPSGVTDNPNLESLYTSIPEHDYLPPYDIDLNSKFHNPALWAPDERRRNMFAPYLFVFMVEITSPDFLEVIVSGGGSYRTFNVHSSLDEWKAQLLTFRVKSEQSDQTIILVAENHLMSAAIGAVAWRNVVEETREYNFQFISFKKVQEAVLFCNASLLDCSAPTTDAVDIDAVIPGTYQDDFSQTPVVEPSNKPQIMRRRTRGTSAAPEESSPAIPVAASQEETQSRKPLRRRAKPATVNELFGIDESQPEEPSQIMPVRAPSVPVASTSYVPASRSKLKRRGPTQAVSNQIDVMEETPLDRHRRLFEETDPDRLLGSQNMDPDKGHDHVLSLAEMVEQADQERIRARQSTPLGRKRKARDAANEGETQLPSGSRASSRAASVEPPNKRRAFARLDSTVGPLEVLHEIEEPLPTNAPAKRTNPKAGRNAEATEVDKDESFLKALASKGKGKKKEDLFDREFNELKLSKPVQVPNQEELEMQAWDELPKDMNLRGNFMVCVPSILPRDPTQINRRIEGNPEWIGRPDFKKFRKNRVQRQGPLVELVANITLVDDNNLSMDMDDEDLSSKRPHTKISHALPPTTFSDEDLDDTPLPAVKRGARARKAQTPLFLPDDDEVDEEPEELQSENEIIPTKAKGGKRKAIVLAESSDSDSNVKKRAKRTRR